MIVPVIGVFTSALQVFVLSLGLGMIVRNVNRTENVVAAVTDRLVKNGLGIFLMGMGMLIWSAFRFGHLEGVAMWTAGGIILILGFTWILEGVVQRVPVPNRHAVIWLVWVSSILTLLLALCYLGLYLAIVY
jgi:putative Mn2+ efflux pump MntP